MAYAHTDFSQARKFGNTTYVMLALAAVILFLLIGTLTSLSSGSDDQKFDGFHMENVATVNTQSLKLR